MKYLDCYAEYQKESGRLTIGNGRICKEVIVRGSFLRTERIRDLQGGAVWGEASAGAAAGEAIPALWQRCPVLDAQETSSIQFDAEVRENAPGIAPHLKAVLQLSGRSGAVWYEFLVFPGIPFVFTQAFVNCTEGTLNETAGGSPETVSCTGIESQYAAGGRDDVFCGWDTLDCIPLGKRHLEAEAFLLYDKTDQNDSLLEHRKRSVYERGTTEMEGNLFHLCDYPHGDSLLLIRHAPAQSSVLNRQSKELLIRGNQYALLTGTGMDFTALPPGRVPYYASAVSAGKTEGIWEDFHQYSTAFSAGREDLFIMSNTWGDRSQDAALCEQFILSELDAAHRLGVEILQIDDGWQKGVSANSRKKAGGVWEGFYRSDPDFWQVNPERFPNGLEPVLKRAAEYGIEIGLWFAPDSSNEFENAALDIETIWNLYQRYGIRYFKLDSIKIRSKLCEMRFIQILETLSLRSGGNIRFNLDVTAEDRFGYLYQTQYGTLFVENRYTDFGNYYPHNTFRNLWELSSILPARRLQMELLNPRRNPQKYAGMPFAPAGYPIDYLFGIVMPSNPLVWMEVSHLGPEDSACLAKIISVYKKYSAELFRSRTIPIGERPNGMTFSGYLCEAPGKDSGNLLLFREETQEDEYLFKLPFSPEQARMEVRYSSASATAAAHPDGLVARFDTPRSFLWISYQL